MACPRSARKFAAEGARKPRARSAGRRPPADADVIAGSPRREASELQALVMERRQLLARQQTPRMREARAGARLSMRLVQEAAARPTEAKFLDAVAAEAAAAEESSVPTGAETTTPTAFGRAESPSLSPPRGPSSSAPTAARARAGGVGAVRRRELRRRDAAAAAARARGGARADAAGGGADVAPRRQSSGGGTAAAGGPRRGAHPPPPGGERGGRVEVDGTRVEVERRAFDE